MNHNRRFTITVGMLALVTAMLVLGTGGASATLSPSTSVLQAQNASQLRQPDAPLAPVTTTFTYQGYLVESGRPANGQYDFGFTLFDAASGGNPIGTLNGRENQTVVNGTFTALLNFGQLNGTAAYLEIMVSPAGQGNFTVLTPRQLLTPAPYAMTLRPGAVISGTLSGGRGPAQTLVVYNDSTAPGTHAIRGVGAGFAGVRGETNNSLGAGVFGSNSSAGFGVVGVSNGQNGAGVFGADNSGGLGDAGRFQGDVQVTGNLSKGGGSFKIDHPLDPANKYLYHSFVESPDMMNIYNGNVTTNAKGEAVVTLPNWFEALNKDFRYQLTIMGEQFAQARISTKIKDNRFTIMTDKPNVEVSWQVTGIRKDAYAEKNRIPVEEDKQGAEKGKYLYPKEQGQPESKGMEYERMQKMLQGGETDKP